MRALAAETQQFQVFFCLFVVCFMKSLYKSPDTELCATSALTSQTVLMAIFFGVKRAANPEKATESRVFTENATGWARRTKLGKEQLGSQAWRTPEPPRCASKRKRMQGGCEEEKGEWSSSQAGELQCPAPAAPWALHQPSLWAPQCVEGRGTEGSHCTQGSHPGLCSC